ncbi:MAG: hypothetical protein M0C28_49120 [Candidatus Moduliflexus flocculans]|nr:hypothetical protein [Candidatus Moduliflexus flocculans]
MTANQFFVPALPEGAARIVLEGAEHRHLARAARVRPGETVWLFDGRGRRAPGPRRERGGGADGARRR